MTRNGTTIVSEGRPLPNTQHETYCRLRISGNSRAKAYNLAFSKPEGHKYGRQSASKLEKSHPGILDRIRSIQQQAVQRSVTRIEIENDYILDTYREVVERCMQAKPVLDRNGEETGEYRFDAKSTVSALNSLAKINGLYSLENKGQSEEAAKNEQQLLEEYHRLNEQLSDVIAADRTPDKDVRDPERASEEESVPIQPIPEAG